MTNYLNFAYTSEMDLEYRAEDGHRHIMIPVFYKDNSYSNDTVDFIIDTGAYITVLTKETALMFGFDKLEPIKRNIPLTGFAGFRIEGDLVEISMLLGGRRLVNAKVAIPHEHTTDNILSLNILEHFNYLVDNLNDKIFFADNPEYKARIELKCGSVLVVTDK
ncbi:MAG: retropepsin-like domain-containing protein [Oscillospiraceae bacterium]|nr:retropepsin-like domain-containing protein [Oscillospiraceae bacterium]